MDDIRPSVNWGTSKALQQKLWVLLKSRGLSEQHEAVYENWLQSVGPHARTSFLPKHFCTICFVGLNIDFVCIQKRKGTFDSILRWTVLSIGSP